MSCMSCRVDLGQHALQLVFLQALPPRIHCPEALRQREASSFYAATGLSSTLRMGDNLLLFTAGFGIKMSEKKVRESRPHYESGIRQSSQPDFLKILSKHGYSREPLFLAVVARLRKAQW